MNKGFIYFAIIAIGCYRLQAQNIDLSGINNSQGVTILGLPSTSYGNVNYAGDVNADGLYDVLLWTDNNLYLIYGTKSGPSNIDLTSFNSTQGFIISGSYDAAFSGTGDANDDGIDDLIITNTFESSVCVILGNRNGVQNVNLTECGSGTSTIQIFGCTPGYTSCNTSLGTTVGGAGDVNGDGIQDMLIVGFQASTPSRSNAGVAYVLFGNKELSNTNLTNLNSTQGFSILGQAFAFFGERASRAGDVNGDGIDDLIIAAYYGFPTYVIYGSTGISDIDLTNFNSSQGFTIYVQDEMQVTAVSNAGDVNGDGIDDLLIGLGNSTVGMAYVLYGSNNMPFKVVLSNITPAQGFSILTQQTSSFAAYASSIGDFNQDGLDDVVISAYQDDNKAGAAYVILGTKSQPASITVDSLTNAQGITILGADANENTGFTISGIRDFNGDNYPDIALGTRSDFVAGYVVYSPYSGTGPNPKPKSAERIGYKVLFTIIMAFILCML